MGEPVPKRKRIIDRATCKALRKPYCEVCGQRSYGGVHHVISRASGGGDVPANLISLCKLCHLGKAHGGHYSKEFLFEVIAKREGTTMEEIENLAWGAKV